MKKLAHPNIVQLIEVMDDPLASSLFMVMCYVERGSIMHCVEPERGRYASPITGEEDPFATASFGAYDYYFLFCTRSAYAVKKAVVASTGLVHQPWEGCCILIGIHPLPPPRTYTVPSPNQRPKTFALRRHARVPQVVASMLLLRLATSQIF